MREKRVDIFDLLKQEGKLETIFAYPAITTLIDPYEKNESKNFLAPFPVKALVRQVSPESVYWKYYGQIPLKSIEVIVEKKDVSLIKSAEKIKYNDEYYKVMKDDSKGFTILERPDYAVIILRSKND
jgi:hypothetical protein